MEACTDEMGMQAALAAARAGIAAGQTPFGCAIVGGAGLVAAGHNRVWASCDPTAHAEISTIRLAAAKLQAVALAGCTLYSTCEPCPMCMAAIHWARLERVVYGACIADAAAAGFHELLLPAKELVRQGGSRVRVEGGCMVEQCRQLFATWQAGGTARVY